MRLSELRAVGDPEMGGLSWEVEERNGRLPLILTLRLWVKQRDSPPRTGIKWVLCSCPSMEKHSAQTGDLPHCLQGVCRKEGWYFLELRYLILTVTAVSTLGSEATMLQKCSTTYFKHNLGELQMKATLLVLVKLMKMGVVGMDEKATGREDLCPWHKF